MLSKNCDPMSFKNLVLKIFILTLLVQCEKEQVSSTPNCVEQKIEQLKKEPVWNPPAKVCGYTYREQTVYFFPQRCCDIPSELYDENCTLICHPDGGITGRGDGKCADFFEKRSNGVLVWEDER